MECAHRLWAAWRHGGMGGSELAVRFKIGRDMACYVSIKFILWCMVNPPNIGSRLLSLDPIRLLDIYPWFGWN